MVDERRDGTFLRNDIWIEQQDIWGFGPPDRQVYAGTVSKIPFEGNAGHPREFLPQHPLTSVRGMIVYHDRLEGNGIGSLRQVEEAIHQGLAGIPVDNQDGKQGICSHRRRTIARFGSGH
jgi:hypothetical protein